MFGRVRIAIRFFFVGMTVGVLLAPRSGRETRRLLRTRADRLFNELLDAATLGVYDPAARDMMGDEAMGDPGNGQPMSRSTAGAQA